MGHHGHYFSDMEDPPYVGVFIADSSYNIQKKFTLEDEGGKLNLHEFSIIDGGKSAIMTMGKTQKENISSVTSKYPNGVNVGNTGFREIDLATGRTKFDWYSLDHGVTVDESFFMKGVGRPEWDFLYVETLDLLASAIADMIQPY